MPRVPVEDGLKEPSLSFCSSPRVAFVRASSHAPAPENDDPSSTIVRSKECMKLPVRCRLTENEVERCSGIVTEESSSSSGK